MGHVRVLKAAAALGDFLMVGVHDDAFVHSYKRVSSTAAAAAATTTTDDAYDENKLGFPVIKMGNRAICALSCRYVDDAVLSAPRIITNEFLRAMHISVVVQVS